MASVKVSKRIILKTKWILLFMCCMMWLPGSRGVDYSYSVNMGGTGCDEQKIFEIGRDDIVQVYVEKRQNIQAGEGTRDSCTVEFKAKDNQRIRVYVRGIQIFDCGTKVLLFDSQTHLVKPRWTLSCDSTPGSKWMTSYDRLVIKLEKLSAQSVNYFFDFALSNSQGLDPEFEQSVNNWYQDVLTDGAIAGIGVSAAIVLLAFILITIWLVVRMKRKRQAEESYRPSKAGSTANSHTTFPSRHYSHGESQDMSSMDSRDAGFDSYGNPAYRSDSPNKDIKSILKSEREFDNQVYEGHMDDTKIVKDKKSTKGFIYRQSRSGSSHSLDKPHIEYTDISEAEYYSDREKSKRKRSQREHSDNERNGVKERSRDRSRTRSERSRGQSEPDYDRHRSREQEPSSRNRHREHSRHRENERDNDRHREYERENDRHRERERSHSRGRSHSESERRHRERDRSYSPSRHMSNGTNGRSSSKPRSNSQSRHRSQSNDRYSSYSRHKTPSNGGRSDYSDSSRRGRSSDRSNSQNQRSSSIGSRSDRNRSSMRRSRR